MSKKHTEERLEDAIEYQFIENDCYQKGASDDYDPARALEPARVIKIVREALIWAKEKVNP